MSSSDVARQLGAHPLSLSGHVGFDSLPDQLVNKSTCQGFCFNILCIGETGIGKSTLMDTLFNTNFENCESSHFEPQVKLRAQTYDLQESNVKLRLTVVNTVGFGDQMNKQDSYQPVVDYIDRQYETYLQEELKIKRSLHNYHDSRLHACLYFISPSGHSLKSLDLLTMKKLDSKVNIIPVIAKADTISKSELHKFKLKIMSELVSNGVQIYQFPLDDETVAKVNTTMNGHLPFAVVGSTEEMMVGNKMVKARQYPWGVVQVENESHCDFVKLREMLICVNMEDLREQTHTRHYELYRRCKLEEIGFRDTDPESKPVSLQQTYEAKRTEFLGELQRREEEMRQLFVQRVKEKEAELKDAERGLQGRFEQLKRLHAEERGALEEKRRVLEEEQSSFSKRRAAAQLLQAQNLNANGKKDKDRKNSGFM
ncbi:septin-10-like isoform X1 [Oncorhynchus nerka]|uniref:Septin n=3 Tax=Oncorhynchus TaxID=8016 RepID=A0A8C8CNL8_ONCTS|nr:septin-10 [Oncorhynchus mykiss]XP_024297185.1 septin-10 isoform X1 [Oncorhynchus tshawytscha]XP_029514258.1 septin-10-like isoform X2 [Oncorhynchus nerka]XP_046182443.1 septin-10-like isoform X1 [Oncorhynchus gorbuscha]